MVKFEQNSKVIRRMSMIEKYREAFAEVNEILKYFNNDLIKKIPSEIIENIKKNMSTKYMVVYDNTRGLNEQDLKQETRAIISVIYRDYICNEKIRNEITEYRIKHNLEERKKYENIDIFKHIVQIQNTDKNKALICIEKQNIITRIIQKVKLIWRKIYG